jgi:hypothetical protein
MLVEFLRYLTTPCPRWSRRHGFLGEAIAFQARSRRCAAAWQDHQERCQRLIKEAAQLAPEHKRAAVFGSGLFLEIPIAILAEQFSTIDVYDAVFLRQARRVVATLNNVRLIPCDLSGVFEKHTPPELDKGGYDFAVSAGLLSQLPLRPLAVRTMEKPDIFARSLIRHHLSQLHRIATVSCLITDLVGLIVEDTPEGEQVITREDPLHGCRMPLPDQLWRWPVAPRPEADPRLHRINLVGGYRQFPGLHFPRSDKDVPYKK